MAEGGLQGAGGGASASTASSRSSPIDSAVVGSYNRADQQARADSKKGENKPETKSRGDKQSGDADKPKTDTPASNDAGLDVPTEDQRQKLLAFDAMQRQVPLGDRDEGNASVQPAKCQKESGSDVALRGAGGVVDGVYAIVSEPVLAVYDAAGSVLHHTVDRALGTDHYKGHAERSQARGEAIAHPIETAKAIAGHVSEVVGDAGDGCYGGVAELGGQVVGSLAGGGAALRIMRYGGNGGRAAKEVSDPLNANGKGTDAAGAKDIADAQSPIAKAEKQDVGETGKGVDVGGSNTKPRVTYSTTVDKPGWGETRRETGSLENGIAARRASADQGRHREADAAEGLQDRGTNIKGLGREEIKPGTKNDRLGEIDIETEHHVIEVKHEKKPSLKRLKVLATEEQLNRGKQPVLYNTHPEFGHVAARNFEEAGIVVVRNIDDLADIVSKPAK